MPRILVIDDEQLLRSTVVTILTRAGFSVEEASDGQAGIAMFHKSPPDVVISGRIGIAGCQCVPV
jgi:DNA-binding response OmpR family regulator